MQNTAIISSAHQAQLSSSIRSQLNNIIKILITNFTWIDGDFKKSFYNQNLIYITMESHHQKFEQPFAHIEAQLAKLGMNPQAPIVQSPQPHWVQCHAVPPLEQGAAAPEPPLLPVPAPLRHLYNVIPSPPPQHQRHY